MSSAHTHIGQSSLFRNSMLNLMGMVLPSLIALVAIPLCVRYYGDKQFGLLSLAWTFIVSFSFLNFGMGISSTKYAAELLRDNRYDKLVSLVWAAVVMNFFVGTLFSVLLFLIAPWVTDHLLTPVAELREATLDLIYYTAFSIPFITTSLSLKGVLEASNRFALANSIKVPSTSLLFILPALGAIFSLSIASVVLLLALSRVVIALVFFYAVASLYPNILRQYTFDPVQIRTLFRFGGWVSISSLLNPIITQGEKVLIPALLSIGVLTYYSAPHEMIARMTVIPVSLSLAILPKFSYLGVQDTRELRENVLIRPVKYLLFALTPIAAFFIFFSEEMTILLLGSGTDFASKNVLIILTCAYFCNSFAALPFSAINGLGHPELKAKWDMVLAPAFLFLSFLLTSGYGIVGAAISKFVALTADMACLYWMLKYLLRLSGEVFFPRQIRILGVVSVGVLLVGGAVSLLEQSIVSRVSSYIVTVALFLLFAWKKSMGTEEREKLKSLVSFLSTDSKVSVSVREE